MVRKKFFQRKNMRYIGQEQEKRLKSIVMTEEDPENLIFALSYLCNVQVMK